jgi:predicted transcriptional regulator
MDVLTNKEFGKLVKKRLIDLEITQGELASKLNINPSYLGHIIQGRKSAGKYKEPILKALALN